MGSSVYDPSTHATPSTQTRPRPRLALTHGVDISSALHHLRECPAYFHEIVIHLPIYEVYLVERGNRPSGLDALLFN